MNVILDHFDRLTDLGFKPIPLRPGTKKPMHKKWNKDWNLLKCRIEFLKWPNANIGLLLGDIVDVEGDSPSANKLIYNFIGNCLHPIYESSKSIHHLFLNPDKDLKSLRYKEIEFRGRKHQSVIPPSKHLDGTIYRWIGDSNFVVPEMPKKLLDFYLNLKNSKKYKHEILKPSHKKVACYNCKKFHFINEKRFNIEIMVFKDFNQPWFCKNCRALDIRELCRIKRKTLRKH